MGALGQGSLQTCRQPLTKKPAHLVLIMRANNAICSFRAAICARPVMASTTTVCQQQSVPERTHGLPAEPEKVIKGSKVSSP